jgi:hypothetical protein
MNDKRVSVDRIHRKGGVGIGGVQAATHGGATTENDASAQPDTQTLRHSDTIAHRVRPTESDIQSRTHIQPARHTVRHTQSVTHPVTLSHSHTASHTQPHSHTASHTLPHCHCHARHERDEPKHDKRRKGHHAVLDRGLGLVQGHQVQLLNHHNVNKELGVLGQNRNNWGGGKQK